MIIFTEWQQFRTSATMAAFNTMLWRNSLSNSKFTLKSLNIKSIIRRFYISNNIFKRNLTSSFLSESVEKMQVRKRYSDNWKSVVGLEIHAQINANSKLFSPAGTVFGAPTNTQVSLFDAAMPGTLPVLNRKCVEAGVLTALALNCTINKISTFDRKHYFYADLPAGYQITQQVQPLAVNGRLDFVIYNPFLHIKPYKCSSRLKQLQLEQDSGRSLHDEKAGRSLIDLNRAGIGLMELVFEPDLRNGEEAAALVRELQLILKKIGTCSSQMEEGALRIDANISVNEVGEPLGVRTEVKNLNSIRYVAKAIDYEIDRQIDILESGGNVINETRMYDFHTKQTISMRDKEAFQDYRFMPEPNLPQLQLCDDHDDIAVRNSPHIVNIDDLRRKFPQLPEETRQYLMKTYHISYEISDRIVKEDGLQKFYENIASGEYNPTFTVDFLLNNVQHQLNTRHFTYKTSPVTSDQIKELVELKDKHVISESIANDILEMLFNGDQRSAKEIVETYNWFEINDEQELEKICQKVLELHPKKVKVYNKKKTNKRFAFIINEVSEMTNHRANIPKTKEILIRLIENKYDPTGTG